MYIRKLKQDLFSDFIVYHGIICFVHYIKQPHLVNLLLFEIAFRNDRFSQQVSFICFEFTKYGGVEYNDMAIGKVSHFIQLLLPYIFGPRWPKEQPNPYFQDYPQLSAQRHCLLLLHLKPMTRPLHRLW